MLYCRSSHQRCSMKKGVLRNFTNFTGKHLCQSLFFNEVAGLRLCEITKHTFLTEQLWTTASSYILQISEKKRKWYFSLITTHNITQVTYLLDSQKQSFAGVRIRTAFLQDTSGGCFWIVFIRNWPPAWFCWQRQSKTSHVALFSFFFFFLITIGLIKFMSSTVSGW